MNNTMNMEAEPVNIIRRRYIHERAIYTWCGIALVAVNPYQEQDIYGDQVVETYHSASHSVYLQLDPHVYAVTEDAYSKLDLHDKDQSIIVSGESGAGKTVSAKHAMRYLASIAGSSRASKMRIENRVLASNPIMEAIGNASTVRNDNSSRFGKYIQIYFNRHGRRILGANMRTYLLEKSRVTKQQSGERNFHIFYQLLNYAYKNPLKMAHLKLLDEDQSNSMRDFDILAGIQPQDSRDDLRRFNEALRTLNIDEQRIDVIYRIVAGILHGGNICFVRHPSVDESEEDDESPCSVDMDEFHFKACCELIGLDPEETRKRLTVKLLKSGARDIIEQPQGRRKAEYARDAMLKYIYECLFTWLVALINLSLGGKSSEFGGSTSANTSASSAEETLASPTTPGSVFSKLLGFGSGGGTSGTAVTSATAAAASVVPTTPLKSPTTKKGILEDQLAKNKTQFIGVLDIYGFENFKTNSFEQFCINYANEVLQQQYNQHVFKTEQEEYIREGIDWTFIEYSDNQPVIDIIESRPIGILNLLDEECKMPKGSDKSWCAKLFDQLLPSTKSGLETARFKRPKLNYQNSFTICHYAEEVNYDVATFLEKNRDSIAEEQYDMLRASEVLKYIFEDPLLQESCRPKMRTSRSATVGCQFRKSLAALIRTLNTTEPHYIRCIKPNDEKKAFEFDEERAVQQLKACGVYETIRISNNGFPSRWNYKDFAKRYCILVYGTPIFEELARKSVERRNHQQRVLAELSAGATGGSPDEQHSSLSSEFSSTDENDNELPPKSKSSDLEVGPGQEQISAESRHFMRNFSSADIRPICEAICQSAYGEASQYEELRTKGEREYIEQLRERHGNQANAIYQFGKTKIFFRAGQVAYLERIRGVRLRNYIVTIQRHVRGWLARKSYAESLEQSRLQASLVLAEQAAQEAARAAQEAAELSLAESEKRKKGTGEESGEAEESVQVEENDGDSVYHLMMDLVLSSIKPLVIDAILENEALDPPAEPFSSLDSSSRSASPSPEDDPMETLMRELDKFHDLIGKNRVPEEIGIKAFKQIFYNICAHSLNQLLIRRDLCQFRKAMQINFNLSCLVQWCRERHPVKWREIVEQLDPITQATKLLQTRKSIEDIATIEEVCNKLNPSQIIKILNMYTSTYEEQIPIEFIRELEAYLDSRRDGKREAAGSIFLA